jgi:DNA repair exonuclease SbcCD ATPase subunit/predicted phosphodiesterase
MKIAHSADIQIRFGSRHDEYLQVFERFKEDLRKNKPDRIALLGDIMHHKINMSPNSLMVLFNLLIDLSEIAPTDIILGNHDLNLQQLEQGDAFTPIVEMINRIQGEGNSKKAYIVNESTKDDIDFSENAIYFYPDSGFYDIGNDIIYGVYSCKDDEILSLSKKEKNKKYIALYHGTVYGSRLDNGHPDYSPGNIKMSSFNNFDIVMLGDIHEYQTFRDNETAAYCGSLIQQNYGESIEKGYLLWDTETLEHKRRFILNDYGFAKLTIAKGELYEERIDNMKLSHDPTKTKVEIIWEEYEENYSVEKEKQIERYVKDKFGCKSVKVIHSEIVKDETILESEKEAEEMKKENFISLLMEFVENGDFDYSEEEFNKLIKLAEDTDKELEIRDLKKSNNRWEVEKMIISNVFSFGVEPIEIDFDAIKGTTGIFGLNYSGKSNTIKALVWGIYKYLLGKIEPSDLVNIYTESNKGYVHVYLRINGERYRIIREVIREKKSNKYPVKYEKLIEVDGKEKWTKEISDSKTLEKKEVEKIVIDAVGTSDDFIKTALQAQKGEDNYITQGQQPKNKMISRFLNLEPYKLRYDYRKATFNDIKRKQKDLGNYLEWEDKIKESKLLLKEKSENLKSFEEEKRLNNIKIEDLSNKNIELTKGLEKTDEVPIKDESVLNKMLEDERASFNKLKNEYSQLEDWLKVNFKKELPFDDDFDINKINTQLNSENIAFKKEKEEYLALEKWVKENPILDARSEDEINSIFNQNESLSKSLAEERAKLPTYKGKSCPTCGSVKEEPNPEKEAECISSIETLDAKIKENNSLIQENNRKVAHNNNVVLNKQKIENLKSSLINRKEKKENLASKIDLFNSSVSIIEHNKEVDKNNQRFNVVRESLELGKKKIDSIKDNIEKLKNNIEKIKNNDKINDEIDENKELIKSYQLNVYNIDKQINEIHGEIRVLENNIENFSDKIDTIKEAESEYKIYSIFLQAVHRDGIPALIIRKKLPLINNKINSLLKDYVEFKVELKILKNGDVVEYFYYADDKSDMLSMKSSSGAQEFLSVLAIKEALHFVSSLTKPSLCIIDEGFGSLDEQKRADLDLIFRYLKNKYKNVLIVTHINEVKDYVDNFISVTKDTSSIDEEILEKNPHAGITKISLES